MSRLWAAYWYGGGVSRRVKQTAEAVKTIGNGDFSQTLPVTTQDESARLRRGVDRLAGQLAEAGVAAADFAAQLTAISKAQAVIEFQMDGTIVTANDNFLKTLGYSLDEIKGRHHSMFVEDSLKNSRRVSRVLGSAESRREPARRVSAASARAASWSSFRPRTIRLPTPPANSSRS